MSLKRRFNLSITRDVSPGPRAADGARHRRLAFREREGDELNAAGESGAEGKAEHDISRRSLLAESLKSRRWW